MGNPNNPPRVSGFIERVPCPWCKATNDFRDLTEVRQLETGSSVECDHCGNLMIIAAVRPTTIIAVHKSDQAAPPRQAPPRAAYTVSPGQLVPRRRG